MGDLSDHNTAVEVTRLLNAAGSGDARASAELLPLVYEQLRALASKKMRSEVAGHTLQATALVHEAYLRIVDQTSLQHWDGRWHFFAAAAEAMRRILVDNARHRSRIKHGGQHQRKSLEEIDLVTVDNPPDDLLALDEALQQLATKHADIAQLVKLRYFAGLSMEQAAEALGLSLRTAERDWAFARAWLYARINSGEA
jgi:RNA polymerase sigma factor (TIGR02999 family)